MLDPDLNALAAGVGPLETWVLPALLGLGLASATGLRTFLPLLALALAARFELFGVRLNEEMEWLVSTPAVAALTVAAVAEFLGDKIPVVDHALDAVGTVARPLAGAVAAGAVFWSLDPTAAAVAGLIVGAPAALAFSTAKGGTRAASTATTGGLGNPVLSLLEDLLSVATVLLALLAPLLVPVLLIGLLVLLLVVVRRFRRPRREQPA